MGRVVILPRAFPLRLCLCPLCGRGRGCRSVMEVNCGTRKSRRRGRRGWGACLRAMVVVMVVVNGRQRTVVVGPERAECLRKGGEGKRSGPVARGWRHARAAVSALGRFSLSPVVDRRGCGCSSSSSAKKRDDAHAAGECRTAGRRTGCVGREEEECFQTSGLCDKPRLPDSLSIAGRYPHAR